MSSEHLELRRERLYHRHGLEPVSLGFADNFNHVRTWPGA